MVYILKITKNGTIIIPKKARDEMNSCTKIVLIQRGNKFVVRPIYNFMEIAERVETNKTFTDEEIHKFRAESHIARHID